MIGGGRGGVCVPSPLASPTSYYCCMRRNARVEKVRDFFGDPHAQTLTLIVDPHDEWPEPFFFGRRRVSPMVD